MYPCAVANVKARDRRPTREQVRERLVRAAAEVLSETGFEASVEEITERAGFSRGAFYSNYERKEELFLEALRRRTEQRIHDLRDQLQGSRNLAELAANLGTGRQRRGPMREFSNYMQFYFHCLARPELREHLAAFEQARQDQFAQALARLLPPTVQESENLSEWARVLSAVDHGLAIQTYLTGKQHPIDSAAILTALRHTT